MTDRRAGKHNVPHVGRQPRARRKDGGWRRKRSDTGKPRGASAGVTASQIVGVTIGVGLLVAAVRAGLGAGARR